MFDIAAQIPPRARRVAELGCLREKAGEAFLRIQPQAEYWGITSDKEELQEAKAFLTHAVYALPETLDFEILGIKKIDVLLVRGEFLCNLTSERLRKWSEALVEEGQLLLDIPNPCYIRSFMERLAGIGKAEDRGFSASEASDILKQAGLHTLLGQGYYDSGQDLPLRQSEANKTLLQGLMAMMREMGFEIVRDRDPWLKGFFFRATKKPIAEERRFLVQTVLGETIVTPRVRIIDPGKFLSTEPGVTASLVGKDENAAMELARRFRQKVFIRQRLSFTSARQAFNTIEGLRRENCVIVGEIDDNPNIFFQEKEAAHLSYIGTHAMQVSTEPLAELMREYNPHVRVIRNELTELPQRREYEQERLERLAAGEDYVTFFFGALNRTEEWQQVMPIINEAAKKYGSRLRFKVLSDRGFFEALATPYKEYIGNKEMYGGQFVPYQMYAEALGSSDISFLPLRDNEFNRTKSDLKFIESAGYGAVAIASPTVYESTVQEGKTGFIYRSPREFKSYLELLVENRALRLATAEAAYEYVKGERLLSGHYMERLEWYRELFAKRKELDQEMMKRLKKWHDKHPEEFRGEGMA